MWQFFVEPEREVGWKGDCPQPCDICLPWRGRLAIVEKKGNALLMGLGCAGGGKKGRPRGAEGRREPCGALVLKPR